MWTPKLGYSGLACLGLIGILGFGCRTYRDYSVFRTYGDDSVFRTYRDCSVFRIYGDYRLWV